MEVQELLWRARDRLLITYFDMITLAFPNLSQDFELTKLQATTIVVFSHLVRPSFFGFIISHCAPLSILIKSNTSLSLGGLGIIGWWWAFTRKEGIHKLRPGSLGVLRRTLLGSNTDTDCQKAA